MKTPKRVYTTGLLALGVCVLAVSGAIAATNLSQRPGQSGCISGNGFGGQCQIGLGTSKPTSLALSPEGTDAYVTSEFLDGVAHLDRNPANGSLIPINDKASCVFSDDITNESCTKTELPLGDASDLAISADGRSIYVTAPEDDALVAIGRDSVTGDLSLETSTNGCVSRSGAPCTAGRALEEATAVIVSPDDKNVYAASSGAEGGIAIFDRNTSTGILTQKPAKDGCVSPNAADTSCDEGPSQLNDAQDIVLSPDGNDAYVVSRNGSTLNGSALLVFDRDPDTGALTQKPGNAGCFVHRTSDVNQSPPGGCQFAIAMYEPGRVTVSSDGKNVYVAAGRSSSIAIFDRDEATGELDQKPGAEGCVSHTGSANPQPLITGACQNGVAMDETSSLAVTPDGSALYATAKTSDGIAVFERNGDGSLDQRPGTAACITETSRDWFDKDWTAGACGDGTALLGANDVTASSNSRYVYATALEGGVTTFDVVEPPPPSPPPPAASPPEEPAVTSAACLSARKDVRVARHRFQLVRRAIRVHRRRAKRAKRPAARRKHHRAIRRNRRRARRWRRTARRSRLLALRYCPH